MNKPLQMKIYDSLTQTNQILQLNQDTSMYVCGPTVYDKIHIGNARTSVVYDSLFRFLQIINNTKKNTYIRNITDIDDKIIQAAKSQNVSTSFIAAQNIEYYHDSLQYLNCLPPTHEPKVSETIPEIIDMINILIKKEFAYLDKDNSVYFKVEKYEDYYKLSKRNKNNNLSRSRELAESQKKADEDFALWKVNSKNDTYGFESPWGFGRPGWHIECSAMSHKYTKHLNIHGGGLDLLFPHHTNEKAQSCCAFNKKRYTDIWMHTGLITVDNAKMSKSLNNFITVHKMKENGVNGEILRLLLLSNHYQKPLNYSEKRLDETSKIFILFQKYYIQNKLRSITTSLLTTNETDQIKNFKTTEILLNNFNIPVLIAHILQLIKQKTTNNKLEIEYCFYVLGLVFKAPNLPTSDTKNNNSSVISTNKNIFSQKETKDINILIEQRKQAKLSKNFILSDQIKHTLLQKYNITLIDNKDGSTNLIKN